MSLYSPLDIDSIFLVDFAGDLNIFVYLAFFILAFSIGKFNLPSKIVYPVFALFAIVMASVTQTFYVLVIILAGMSVFYSIGRIGK